MFTLEDSTSIALEHRSCISHWLRKQTVFTQDCKRLTKEGRFLHIQMLHLIIMQSELAELDHDAHRSNRLDSSACCMHTMSPIVLNPHTAYGFVKDGPWKGKEVEVWSHALHVS